jgi:sugar transferase EpsL
LRGEMSIVGPRPLLVEYLPGYTPEQLRRHEVKPGITGLAQVQGRQELPWEERFRLDVWYVDHWSLRLDAEIVLATVRALLSGQSEVEASSPEYYFDPYATIREDGSGTDR